jgi:hypothetical protein
LELKIRIVELGVPELKRVVGCAEGGTGLEAGVVVVVVVVVVVEVVVVVVEVAAAPVAPTTDSIVSTAIVPMIDAAARRTPLARERCTAAT